MSLCIYLGLETMARHRRILEIEEKLLSKQNLCNFIKRQFFEDLKFFFFFFFWVGACP